MTGRPRRGSGPRRGILLDSGIAAQVPPQAIFHAGVIASSRFTMKHPRWK
jgi:hypothetical protein